MIPQERMDQELENLSPREYQVLCKVLRDMGATGSQDAMYQMLAEVYEEFPVPMGEFLYGEHYLNLRGTLFPKVADVLVACDDRRIREYYLMLGRGGGKSTISECMMARSVYRMLCYRNPRAYLELAQASSLAVVNMSTKADQAERVIFTELCEMIRHAPWFHGKYHTKGREMKFDKGVVAYAGNSSPTAYLGYQIIAAVVDEANFMRNTASGEMVADELVTSLRGSMQTRAPHDHKLGLISSVRAETDYLSGLIDGVKERGYPVSFESLGQEGGVAALVGGA